MRLARSTLRFLMPLATLIAGSGLEEASAQVPLSPKERNVLELAPDMIPVGNYKVIQKILPVNSRVVRFKGPDGKELYAQFEDLDGDGFIQRKEASYWHMTESASRHTDIITSVKRSPGGKVLSGYVQHISDPHADKEIRENLGYTPEQALQKIEREFLPVATDAKLVGGLERFNQTNDTYLPPVILQEKDSEDNSINYIVHIDGKDGKSNIIFRADKNAGKEIDLNNVAEATLSDREKPNRPIITEWKKNNYGATSRTFKVKDLNMTEENKKMITSQDAAKIIFNAPFKPIK